MESDEATPISLSFVSDVYQKTEVLRGEGRARVLLDMYVSCDLYRSDGRCRIIVQNMSVFAAIPRVRRIIKGSKEAHT